MSIDLSHAGPICKQQEGQDTFLICRAQHAHAEPHVWERYLPIVEDRKQKGYIESSLGVFIVYLMGKLGIESFKITRAEFAALHKNPKVLTPQASESGDQSITFTMEPEPSILGKRRGEVNDAQNRLKNIREYVERVHDGKLERVDHLAPGHCPACGVRINASTALTDDTEEDRPPEPGDMSVCVKCGAVLLFTHSMRRIVAPAEEIKALPEDQRKALAHVVSAVLMSRTKRHPQ